jgi:tripartite-type tricarboxylate transporter receptor subunit TctC
MPVLRSSMDRRRVLAIAAGAASGFALPGAAVAQAMPPGWPSRYIRLISPGAAGGPFDLIARATVHPLEKTLGQPIVPDYKPGAGGNLGVGQGARAPADNYNFVVAALAQLVLNPAIDPNVGYDPDRDLVPVVLLSRMPYVLVVHPSVPARTAKDLIALAKSRPGQLNYASHGSGTTSHITTEMFKKMFGVDIAHIPYKTDGQAVTDLVGGQVQMMFNVSNSVARQVQAGALRALVVASRSRLAQLPEVPTFEEAGLQPMEAETWFALMAPAGTSPSVVEFLNAEVNKQLQMPEVQRAIAQLGSVPGGGSVGDLRALIAQEKAKWRPIVAASGAKPT